MRDVLVMAFFIPSLPICFVRPYYGILLWSIVAFANPQSLAFGFASAFPLAEAVGIPTLAGFIFFHRDWRNLASREFFLILILWGWFAVTSVVSIHTPALSDHAGDTLFRLIFVSKILLMATVAICVTNSFARLRVFALVIAGCFGFFVAKDLPFTILTGGRYTLYGPPASMIADNNDFGLALNMVVPLFFFLARTESNRKLKAVLYGLFLATLPAVFFTYSRGALVGLAAVLCLMLLQLKMRQRLALFPIIVLAFIFALFFTPQAWRDRMSSLGNETKQLDPSAMERVNAWKFSWNLAHDFPLTGGGFDTFTPDLFKRYAPDARDVHGPHSIYFGVLAEHGFIGLFLYLSLVFCALITTFIIGRQARRYEDDRALAYALMFRLSLVGFLTSGLFLGRAYFDFYFADVGCIIVLKSLCERAWSEGRLLDQPDEYPEEQEEGSSDELALAGGGA